MEKVRFASSAVDGMISIPPPLQTKLMEHTLLEMKLAMGCPLLRFCGC